jgi:magnesium transporter
MEKPMDNLLKILDPLHAEDLANTEHPSIFDENEAYDMLIMRLPVIDTLLDMTSMSFIITPEKSYYYNKGEKRFQVFDDRFNGPYKTIDTVVDRLLKAFSKYKDLIADMEEFLYLDKNRGNFMTQWMDLKRDILRIERVLLRTSETMQEVIEYYEDLEGFPINNYVDLHEHLDRITRSAGHQLSKLDYLYSFYNTRTNEKMNSLIFALTIISAVFLPLNLVVGFFGMNTSGLPFAEGTIGTLKAILLMFSLMTVTSFIVYLSYKKVKTPEE